MARLFITVFLLCCVPAIGGIWFYAHQSAAQARVELSEHVTQLHEQSIQRLQRTFEDLDNRIQALSGDYVLQRMSDGQMPKGTAEELEQREYVDSLIRRQTAQLPFVKNICITFEANGNSLCSQGTAASPLFDFPGTILQKQERWLTPLTKNGEKPGAEAFQVAYGAPVTDRRTGVVKGTVRLTIELNGIMKEIYGKWPLRNQLLDTSGEVIYNQISPNAHEAYLSGSRANKELWDNKTVELTHLQPIQWTDDTMISQRKLDLLGIEWISRLEVPQSYSLNQLDAFLHTLWIGVLLLLLVFLLSAYLFRHYFTRPMQQLRSLMHRAELGDFKAYWTRRSSRDWNELGESYNQMLNRLEELIKQVKREQSLKKEAEMEALQYQLNPHFLYNTLNTIKWVAKMHKTPQIGEAVTSLVRLLQASLGKKGDFITIREEIGLLRDYMEIQAFRYGERIRLECHVEPLAQGCLVPRMILQPLLENAIIHGIEPGRKEGLIIVRIWLEPEREMLFCQVEDNGIGMTEETDISSPKLGGSRVTMRERMSGIGLHHIREKIKLYYGSGYSMQIISKPKQGTAVKLTMPAHYSEVG